MSLNSSENFKGKINTTISKSIPYWPKEKYKEKGTNVVYIVLDDMGFSHLGCFGSNISTPNIDSLAENGLIYNNFHTTALCSPTRSCLLSGANHHAVGMSVVSEIDTGFPNARGRVDKRYGLLSEILKENGYSTFALGKWHLTPGKQQTGDGDFEHWPLRRGFDRFYGFLPGMTNQWNPDLVEDNHRIRQPKKAEDGYHLTEDITDKAIKYIANQKSNSPNKPFFLYLAYGAMHSPHHAPKKFIDRYKGKFDEGWDVIRERWFNNQKKIGIIPKSTKLTDRNELVSPWDSLTEDKKKYYARHMEVYAGFLEHTDYHIGRVISYLKEIDEFENTIIVFLSDNGASAEGGEHGQFNVYKSYLGHIDEDILQEDLDRIDDLGSPKAFNCYPAGWGHAGNTPFKWYKSFVHAGGVKDPLIIHYPSGISDKGGIRNQYHHVTDVTPTVLDVLGIEKPISINGVYQLPMHGVSLKYTFDNEDAKTKKDVQYYEMFGNRAIYSKGWKAVARHIEGENIEDDVWELYNVEEDYSEYNNLAKIYPKKLRELINLWWVEAGKYDVLPILDISRRKRKEKNEKILDQRFEFLQGTDPISSIKAPNVNDKSHKIKAYLNRLSEDEEGVLVSFGGRFGGYSLYIKDNLLKYHFNFFGYKRYEIVSDIEVPIGKIEVEYDFRKTGENIGIGRLLINSEVVGEEIIENINGIVGMELFSIGSNEMTPVTEEYEVPFKYTGDYLKVAVEIKGTKDASDSEIDLALATE
ncbi:arylsulfatase [Gottschalkia purinilytica]|uniref:Arylsulfatase n=1 Tax=Gottschalkia purinilytica TaxID=1503 RepID=A0A0L0WDQ9_GOTPU|nr:arylsulfatase [Gottschalkia purinilytica]KNF09550.1 arylsulfatase [Gottschalkia purinilytica]